MSLKVFSPQVLQVSSHTSMQPHIKSDVLADLRPLLAVNPVFASIIQLYRVRLVIDANVILSDLRWLARRRNPEARTTLQEVIAAGTVVAFAPSTLGSEIEEHLPRIAREGRVDLGRLQSEWLSYQQLIHFRSPVEGALPSWVQDPDDLPYLFLRMEIGAEAIYTNDSDIAAMGAPVVGTDVVVALKEYSRATSVEVTIKLGGTAVMFAGSTAVVQVFKALRQIVDGFGRLPRTAKVMVGLALLGVLAHPRGRAFLAQTAMWFSSRARAALDALGPLFAQATLHASESQQKANTALERVRPALPAAGQWPARVHALRVCLEATAPLPLEEVARRVLEDGYVTRSNDFPTYLRRVLRARPEFHETPAGFWAVLPAAVP